jgi:hypothetical protein
MLLPLIIFLMILSPVLIPMALTAGDAIVRWQRSYRPAQAAGYPRRMPSRSLAAAAA